MRVWIRKTQPSDISDIFALRNDPAVLQEQYKPGFGDTPESFAARMIGVRDLFGQTFQCSSIFADEEFVGHIMQTYSQEWSGQICDCGWNLAPSHWGRGIMPRALELLFDSIFADGKTSSILASCFATNVRCLRVLEKLGFQPQRMGWFQILLHFLIAGGYRKVLQFRLTREAWLARVRSSV